VTDAPNRTLRLAWIAALVFFAAGVALLMVANRDLAGARGRIEKRNQERLALREIESRLDRYESALRDVEGRQPGTPAGLQAIVTNAMPGIPLEFRPVPATNAVAGWSVRSIEVTGKAVPLDGAMRTVRELDSVWPRWVLVDLQIRSSAEAATGRVTMRFETVARQDGPAAR
jgi:hypothetical protein